MNAQIIAVHQQDRSVADVAIAAVLALIALSLSACTTQTLYKAADPDYGYREQQIEQDRFRVVFAGNALTDRDTVENYLLFRAAELTLANDYDYFVLSDHELETRTRESYVFSGYPGYGGYRLYGYAGTWSGGHLSGQTSVRSRYEAVANIVMFKGQPAKQDVKAFEAREVLRYLSDKVVRPPGVSHSSK